MGLLEEIVSEKRREIERGLSEAPLEALQREAHYHRDCVSLAAALGAFGSSGVIAELKRKSPSRGEFNAHLSIADVSTGYVAAGAAALSILTDKRFFGGSADDVREARAINSCPILRKEFIIDSYQIHEAKAMGADAILLIARILEPEQLRSLARLAVSIGLEVLCEVHDELELGHALIDEIKLVGINSRNLDTLSIDRQAFERIGARIPEGKVRIAESGISDPNIVRDLRSRGFSGFLIGENFMKTNDPARACREFISAAR